MIKYVFLKLTVYGQSLTDPSTMEKYVDNISRCNLILKV